METKEPIKIKLTTLIILILVLVVIVLTSYIIYIKRNDIEESKPSANNVLENNVSNSEQETVKIEPVSLKLGRDYTVDQIIEDGAGNEDCGITLEDKNNFSFNLGFGTYIEGTYEINGTTLICNAIVETSEYVEDNNVSGTLTFKINNDQLTLTKINVENANTTFDEYTGLKIGMTYTIKE